MLSKWLPVSQNWTTQVRCTLYVVTLCTEITDDERQQSNKIVVTPISATPRPSSTEYHRPPASPQRSAIDEFIVHHKERTSPKNVHQTSATTQASSKPSSQPTTGKQTTNERRNWSQGGDRSANREIRPKLEDPDYKSLLEVSPPKPFNKKKVTT